MSILASKDPAGFIAEALQKKQNVNDTAESIQKSKSHRTSSSIAGADSSQFHIYRKLRRIELERDNAVQAQLETQESEKKFQERRLERVQKELKRTEKNRAKRLKKKAKYQL